MIIPFFQLWITQLIKYSTKTKQMQYLYYVCVLLSEFLFGFKAQYKRMLSTLRTKYNMPPSIRLSFTRFKFLAIAYF